MIPKSSKRLIGGAVALFAVVFANVSAAETLLTLENSATEVIIELSEEDLLELEQHEIVTGNDFVDGEVMFSGPLARDVVELLGEGFETVRLAAVNDYAVDVPFEDFENYDVIFAMTQDTVKLSRRDKGPIWVVYPMSDNEELQEPIFNDRMIWQLVRVTVE